MRKNILNYTTGIPVSKTVGDIWTKVDIQFKPMVHDNGISGQIMIDSFNNRLDGLAGELEVQIRKWLEEKFKDD